MTNSEKPDDRVQGLCLEVKGDDILQNCSPYFGLYNGIAVISNVKVLFCTWEW